MAGVWNILQCRLVLGDTALSLFYAVLRSRVSAILLSGTLLKNKANLVWNACFVSGWPETIKIGILLLPTVTSIVLGELKGISIAASHLVCNSFF